MCLLATRRMFVGEQQGDCKIGSKTIVRRTNRRAHVVFEVVERIEYQRTLVRPLGLADRSHSLHISGQASRGQVGFDGLHDRISLDGSVFVGHVHSEKACHGADRNLGGHAAPRQSRGKRRAARQLNCAEHL